MENKKDRIVVCFSDGEDNQSAIDNLNGYCCNLDYIPIQIQVMESNTYHTIFAILEKTH